MRRSLILLVLATLLTACTRQAPQPPIWTPSSPFVPLQQPAGGGNTRRVPTLAPLQFVPLPTRGAGTPAAMPTPDPPHRDTGSPGNPQQYTVQPGDTLGSIADQFGLGINDLALANGIANPNLLDVGQVLVIPTPPPGLMGSDWKIIPDSELVNGPASATLDIPTFLLQQGGYLGVYAEAVDGIWMTGAQIVQRVAYEYSVSPRLLLAVLEYQSGWVTNPDPAEKVYAAGNPDPWRDDLYSQLAWAANQLNLGYYRWRAGEVPAWALADGSIVPTSPRINAGTAAVQHLFAQLDDRPTWDEDVSINGLFKTYFLLFANPFDLAVEPLIPAGLSQPVMQLPFAAGESWSFTGGPHGGWDSGSAWAALDFAPPGEPAGCTPSDAWVRAVADGWIVRADNGAVVQDLDGDGYEQTGWTVLYMHVESSDRVQPGAYVFAGDPIGHPSCEGGLSNGTHVHIARRYNGEWIPADGPLPFVLDGWVSSGNGIEYDGWLTRSGTVLEAFDGRTDSNQVAR